MENLFQIIHVNSDLMEEFLKDTSEEISFINELLKVETGETSDTINKIFQRIHSVKGNALLLGLNSIANKLKEFEDYLKELQNSDPTWRELLKVTVNLAELKHDISQINELIDKIILFQKKVGEDVKNKKYIFEESLKKSLTKLGVEYNKDVNLDLTDYDMDIIPEKYRRLFKDSVNQFIRNSLAHGIEEREVRIKQKKDPQGKIKVSIKNIDDKIEFIYRDDGQGLNINNIKKAAVEKKGYSEQQVKKLSGADAVKLIFSPGFSTSESVDKLSGQGIGMSVIKSHVDKVGGKLNIKSSSGNFCEFRILLHQ
jgi:chemotaxis protein histidine kinase CheA